MKASKWLIATGVAHECRVIADGFVASLHLAQIIILTFIVQTLTA